MTISSSPAAQRDLDRIYQFGYEQWGEDQADAYLERLTTAFQDIGSNPLIGLELAVSERHIRLYQVGRHRIIYEMRAEHIAILRLLHTSVNLSSLAKRLGFT